MIPSANRVAWQSALFGAAAGALVMIALALSGIPLHSGRPTILAVLLFTVTGAVLGSFGSPRLIGWTAVAAAGVAALLTLSPMLDGRIERWVRRDAIPAQPLDGLVVLSSGMTATGRLDPEGVERLLSAMYVVAAHHPSMLITTRIVDTIDGRAISTDADQREIIGSQMDTARWRIVAPVYSTHDEALRTASVLAPDKARLLGVVTSPLHSRRACQTFEGVGFRVACLPADSRAFTPGRLRAGGERFKAFVSWFYEQLAMMKYRRNGWIRG
jgi:uncharacterized SAM-binding protein YcdF (DUF218 family)